MADIVAVVLACVAVVLVCVSMLLAIVVLTLIVLDMRRRITAAHRSSDDGDASSRAADGAAYLSRQRR